MSSVGRRQRHAVLVLGRTTRRNRLQQGRVARSRPRRDRLVPVGFSETEWVLFLEKKNCVIFPYLNIFRVLLKKNVLDNSTLPFS